MKKAVFLDRDGTLNHDPGYLSDPEKLVLLPGVPEGLRRLGELGLELIVISNQSGIGRGLMSEADVRKVHNRINELLQLHSVSITGFYFCPHHPDTGCLCRKPGTELIEAAAQDHGIDLRWSFVVGDKDSDIQMGKRVGCRTILLGGEKSPLADHHASSFTEAVSYIERSWAGTPKKTTA